MRALVSMALFAYISASSLVMADPTFVPTLDPRIEKAGCSRQFSRLKFESASPSAVRVLVTKNRRLETLKFGSRPTYRASTADVVRVRQAYPQLAKNIDDFTEPLGKVELKKKVSEIYEVPGLQRYRDPDYAKFTKVDIEKIDPKLKKAIVDVWNRLNDPIAFQMHTKSLAEDAAVEMLRLQNGKSLKALESGELTETAVLRVLVKRQRAKGEKNFSTLKDFISENSKNPNEFVETIARGPFFDKEFRGQEHSMSMHLLQRDYVDDVIWTATEGQPQLFWNLLADQEYRDKFWDILFEDASKTLLVSPEGYAHHVQGLLKLR